MAISFNSTVKEIMNDEGAKAILLEIAPQIPANPQLKLGMHMKMSQVVKFPQAEVDAETAEKLKNALDEYGAK